MYPTKLNDVAKAVGVPGLAGYGDGQAQQANVQRQPEIAAALENVETELKSLHEMIQVLGGRLEPVSRSIPESENEKPAQPFGSPLAGHISNVANSIHRAAQLLAIIHSRLEI